MTLHQIFIRTAKRLPKKTCCMDKTTGKTVTYERALIGALILAEKFRRYEPGFVGIMLPTGLGCTLASIGALMSGRVPVMINFSGAARDNALYAQKKCDFLTIITARALLDKIGCERVEGMVFIEDIMEEVGLADKLTAMVKSKLPIIALERLIHAGDEDDNCVILFTSGSEKDPKAVQLTHKNIRSNIESIGGRFSLNEADTFLCNLPFFHVFGITANLWAPLYFGMTSVAYASPIDYARICEIIREEKPTLIAGTPAFFLGYLRKSEPGDFESLRVMIVGADKCPEALRKGYLDRHGKVLFEAYGTTETSPGISGNALGMNKPGSVGKPFKGMKVRIEQVESGEDCAVGEIGRILVKGDAVMRGYFDDFEETAMRIRHGWYDTGDLGMLDEDGYLWHVGRLRRFVKIGGEMVSLVKVENVLEEFLPEGVECCVVEVPDHLKGSRIVAAVTRQIEERETIKKMSEKLPNIAMPKQFAVISELPKLGSGKIDFRTTTEMVRDMLNIHHEKSGHHEPPHNSGKTR